MPLGSSSAAPVISPGPSCLTRALLATFLRSLTIACQPQGSSWRVLPGAAGSRARPKDSRATLRCKGSPRHYRDEASRRVVENDPECVALAPSQYADTMAQPDLVLAACAPDRASIDGKQHRIALREGHHVRA